MDQRSEDTPENGNVSIKNNRTEAIQAAELHMTPKLSPERIRIYKLEFKRGFPFTSTNSPINQKIPTAVKTEENPSKQKCDVLDAKSTNYRLDYPAFNNDQLRGIGAKDYITFYSWIKQRRNREKKEDTCKLPVVHKNKTKNVPNYGLSPEYKSKYTAPVRISQEDLKVDIKDNLKYEPLCHEIHTENKIYGSGERVEKYIDTLATHILSKH